jgi:hypothetical protein
MEGGSTTGRTTEAVPLVPRSASACGREWIGDGAVGGLLVADYAGGCSRDNRGL